ncbi:energy-coupling factor transporter transmembrane protein EcfT [Eubacteriales bacterium OttesenSCG-928-G02]|nr:energy-coupling factor transporter transmembrane protein EcfT [Eubacteriales bacterium OttesenSCG-928-G02]
MIKDITFGQYFPGDSLLHKTDARAKIIILIAYLTAILMAKSTVAFIAVLILTICFILISKINVKILLKSIKPLIFILIFTAVINIFMSSGEHLLIKWWIIKIYAEGIKNAIMMALRLIALIMGTSVILSYTTSPLDITDALESLLSPLKKIKVPVHEFAMIMTIALRFIPTLIEETDKIMSAQKARGVSFDTGKLTQRIKALIPILIPLFFSAIRRAYELAEAMMCRLYHGGEGRTRMKVLHLKAQDVIFVLFMIGTCVGVYFLNRLEFINL